MSRFEDLKIVLIQARSTSDIEQQEQECFLERCRIGADQIQTRSVLRDALDERLLDDFDVVMIGGAGEYSATGNYSWMEGLLDLIRACHRRSKPTFGSCWGHQLIARALGGHVIHDSDLAELGCHHITLTEAGLADPLFGRFPSRFLVNMGHHDRVAELPPGAVELAVSDTQPHQAFRMAGKPMYGTQFHSELDARRERERLYRYREHYPEIAGDASFQAVLDNLAETGEADHLLHDFLATYVVSSSTSSYSDA